ncbi:glycosyltransferase family 25 protein [Acetobacter oeni]|uniref:Glycosyl transferase family 25 domain-containing protein n=1 Tax=Acetobacter oeni TaxID=304077 RepID=A0A511XH55_9PROT|nr:glycosyltransferase family 25 protein [Acetobacter oeni]MBB3882410.1 GR25 family glycosyltransferase involved in LPS biosynthesis [Acetobacter oeni]NHO18492.1 glycosyl transferase family 25 [Acetobacter oeni]GBR00493.1 glycosyltransferase [Acetobacter oeni LMG 21952]GEN62268.1 hypothetical protein AOE01nite_04920 [Acetobacter oeni]
MKYIVINRDCDQDRYSEFTSDNSHISDIRKFSAIDGRHLDSRELIQNNIIEEYLNYTKGALGSAMSHLLLWNAVVENNEPACIFEDDAMLCGNFAEESEAIISQLPKNWDIILWGNNYDTTLTFELLPGISHCISQFDQESLRKGAHTFRNMNVRSLPFKLFQTLGICGYAISPAGARNLISQTLPLPDRSFYHVGLDRKLRNTSIDHVMADHYRKMNAFTSFPPLCITKNEPGKSTILRS